jgi:hypothetical protein
MAVEFRQINALEVMIGMWPVATLHSMQAAPRGLFG